MALVLPGMSLNATIFPPLGLATVETDFNRFAPPHGTGGMGSYLRVLDELGAVPQWAAARRRLVIGHSFGGMLALAWLLAHGGGADGLGRVDGAILISTTAGPMYDAVRLRVFRMAGREVRTGIRWFMPLWNTRPITRLMKRLFVTGGGTEDVDFQRLTDRSDWALEVAGWLATEPNAKRAYRAAMRGFDVRERLGEIGVRAIVLHGTDDPLFPLASAHILADGLRHGELRVIQGAGHVLPLTHGAAVSAAVRELLAPKSAG